MGGCDEHTTAAVTTMHAPAVNAVVVVDDDRHNDNDHDDSHDGCCHHTHDGDAHDHDDNDNNDVDAPLTPREVAHMRVLQSRASGGDALSDDEAMLLARLKRRCHARLLATAAVVDHKSDHGATRKPRGASERSRHRRHAASSDKSGDGDSVVACVVHPDGSSSGDVLVATRCHDDDDDEDDACSRSSDDDDDDDQRCAPAVTHDDVEAGLCAQARQQQQQPPLSSLPPSHTHDSNSNNNNDDGDDHDNSKGSSHDSGNSSSSSGSGGGGGEGTVSESLNKASKAVYFWTSLVATAVPGYLGKKAGLTAQFMHWNYIVPHLLLGAIPVVTQLGRSGNHLDQLRRQLETRNETLGLVVACLEDDELNGFGVNVIQFAKEVDWRRHVNRHVVYVRVPMEDTRATTRFDAVARAVEALHACIAQRQTAYVHCKAGKGRSWMVTMCYLTTYGGLPYDVAAPLVQERRGQINPSVAQQCFAREFALRFARWRPTRVLSSSSSSSSSVAAHDLAALTAAAADAAMAETTSAPSPLTPSSAAAAAAAREGVSCESTR